MNGRGRATVTGVATVSTPVDPGRRRVPTSYRQAPTYSVAPARTWKARDVASDDTGRNGVSVSYPGTTSNAK